MAGHDLYICHTPYHVLIALARALRARPALSDIVLSSAIPDAEGLRDRLAAAGQDTVWCGLWVVDEAQVDAELQQSWFYKLRHCRDLPCFALDTSDPDLQVYISNDWSAFGRYLQAHHIPYTLCEDTFGGTLDTDQHLLDAQRAEADFAQKQQSGKGYLYWGDSKWATKVETEDASRCGLFPEKRVEHSKKALLHSLTEEEKAQIRKVFLTQPLPESAEGATLLLPRSFVLDGLMDQPTQDAMFRAVAKKYAAGPLFIKTHPRDDTDYAALFPGAVILDRSMPSEVLNFCLPFRFAKAVTVQSWVLRAFEAADEKIMLPLEDALALARNK